MVESDLSTEVNATTVLPAASSLSASVNSNNNIDLSWTNNDDSPDGGIDVERSTNGFSTTTTVALALVPSTNSFTDTSVSEGTTYEYRIERNTDHATATGTTVQTKTPIIRSVTVTGEGATTTTREVQFDRVGTTRGDGQLSATRAKTLPRNTTVTGDGEKLSTRQLTKERAATTTGDGDLHVRAEFREVFPEEQTNNLSWDFSFDDPFGFVSEWITESRDINDTEAFTVVVDSNVSRSYYLGVEYDVDGDGNAEHRTEPQHVTRDGQTLVFPSVGDPGQYRLYIQQMRPDDYLRELTVGLTRY